MTEASAQQGQDGRADFDFIIGRWHVYHRRLRERLQGSTTWDEFDGVTVDRSILGGLGNIGEAIVDRGSGPLSLISIRLFDPASQQWSVYFANSAQGSLTTPMMGKFTQGRGVFYAHEIFEGKPIFTRLIWSDMTATSCHWEQAFSADGGGSWETNWIMDLSRQQMEQQTAPSASAG